MKLAKECCFRYRKKGKACKDCPKFAGMKKRKRKKLLARYKR